MHWTIEQVRDLEIGEFDELVSWVNERAEKRKNAGDGESIDMDVVLKDKVTKHDGNG